MRLGAFFAGIFAACTLTLSAQDINPYMYTVIEVTGSATVSIVPDRITVEIGMEEYYRKRTFGDSTLVRLSEIEDRVRRTLRKAGIADSLTRVSDIGNTRNPYRSNRFLMAKQLSVTLDDFGKIEQIASQLDRDGITGIWIARIDNSDIESYNRRGLKAALDAANDKAALIAGDQGLRVFRVYEVTESGPSYYETPSFSNVSFEAGAGMDDLRRIVRRYSVKVKCIACPPETQQ